MVKGRGQRQKDGACEFYDFADFRWGDHQGEFGFVFTCPGSTYETIHYLVDVTAQPISYKTFRLYADLDSLGQDHPALYRISRPDNWSVSFDKGFLPSGIPAVWLTWSRIEHVFVPYDFAHLVRQDNERQCARRLKSA